MASEETDIRPMAAEQPAPDTETTAAPVTDAPLADGLIPVSAGETPDGLVADAQPTALQLLKDSVREDDPKPLPTLTLWKIIFGEIFNSSVMKQNIWLILLIVLFTVFYVAFRYQCQQDMITIDKLETDLKDAKYRALSSSSTLTERCRESHVLEILRNNKDSLLHIAEQPPYIIEVPE